MTKDVAKQVERAAVPSHLIEASTEELKASVEESMEDKKEEIDPNDPRLEESYTFNFKWKDGRGKLWEGTFTNKILSIKEQQGVGVMRATLSGGVDARALDVYTAEINAMIAHLSFSLIQTPKWADDLRELKDVKLLQAIYQEVADHEAMFFGNEQY